MRVKTEIEAATRDAYYEIAGRNRDGSVAALKQLEQAGIAECAGLIAATFGAAIRWLSTTGSAASDPDPHTSRLVADRIVAETCAVVDWAPALPGAGQVAATLLGTIELGELPDVDIGAYVVTLLHGTVRALEVMALAEDLPSWSDALDVLLDLIDDAVPLATNS